jgi:hypothetical protein
MWGSDVFECHKVEYWVVVSYILFQYKSFIVRKLLNVELF